MEFEEGKGRQVIVYSVKNNFHNMKSCQITFPYSNSIQDIYFRILKKIHICVQETLSVILQNLILNVIVFKHVFKHNFNAWKE